MMPIKNMTNLGFTKELILIYLKLKNLKWKLWNYDLQILTKKNRIFSLITTNLASKRGQF
jgi:hypothetical protein